MRGEVRDLETHEAREFGFRNTQSETRDSKTHKGESRILKTHKAREFGSRTA